LSAISTSKAERIYRVPALSLPGTREASAGSCDAVALFADRAPGQRRPSVALPVEEEPGAGHALADPGLDHLQPGVKGDGTGIASMAGRVEAVGGSLTAGPVPNGRGWLLQVTIPVAGGPDSEVDA